MQVRNALTRAGGLVAILAAVMLAATGCGPLGESEDDKAADAAATYKSDLEAFAAEVQDAAKEQYLEEDDEDEDAKRPKTRKARQRSKEKARKEAAEPSPLEIAVAEPPELPEFDSDEPTYVTAQGIAERLGPIVDELNVLGAFDNRLAFRQDQALEKKQYAFSDDVFSRSTNYIFNPDTEVSVFGSDKQLANLAEEAIGKEVREWSKYRKRIEGVKSQPEILASYQGFELEGIDREIALFEEYRKHLRQTPPNAAQLAYYDEIWPDEEPLRLSASGAFNSLGEPYFKSLTDGKRIVRSMADDVSGLAAAETIDEETPAAGDAYRDAIIDGFLPTREKYKYRNSQVNFRAWMLYRIRELEDTPDEIYEAAEETIYLELLEDSRNTYDTFLALLMGFNDTSAVGAREAQKLKTFIDVATVELAGTYPPILDPTRKGFLRALDIIDPDLLDKAYGKTRGLDALETSFDARDKVYKQYDQARKKIQQVLREGATAVDSTKKLRRAMIEAVEATKPAP